MTLHHKALQDDLPGPSGTDSGSEFKGFSTSPRPPKRVTIAQGHETCPSEKKRHVSGDNTVYSDEEILEMAKKDLAMILGLEVKSPAIFLLLKFIFDEIYVVVIIDYCLCLEALYTVLSAMFECLWKNPQWG